MMKFQKRAQMELIGIAVVVMLVSLGLIFAIKFEVTKPKRDIKQAFTQKELAQNFVTTLLSTSTGCRNNDVSDLILDCIKSDPTAGQIGRITCSLEGEQLDSCAFYKRVAEQMLDKTLKTWFRDYRLEVVSPDMTLDEDKLITNSSEFYRCRSSKPGWGYIPLFGGKTITVRLDVC